MKSTRAIRFFTILSVAIVALSAITWMGLGRITSAIPKLDVFSGLENRPKKESSAVNYLIVGSDTREGLSRAEIKRLRVGGTDVAAGKRSDTMLLVHISKKRDKAAIISIPRDSYALIPEHKSINTGKNVGAAYSKINSAYNWGGAPLLIQTFEEMSGLRIDHYVEINFVGFVRMVDALGGIEICTKRDINDPKSHLTLPAGRHILDGVDSLKYVRSRTFDGLGDLGRMKRQQEFAGAMLRRATSAGVLLNPIKLVDFVNSALASVTTDSNLSQGDLLTLGKQLRNLSSSNVRTLTIPLKYYNYSKNGVSAAVLWDPVLSAELFERIKNDDALIDEVRPEPSVSPSIVNKFGTSSAGDNPCKQAKE
ncbi:MAG: LytR family transcriptional regulator [Actinobacteria bacterium]|nr:LytR family transcriptional regulator [Actinomycetota bacterium]NDA38710.1 LytR family transcriptional regulator [Actinomycetota bacterium]NDE12124.1 LytR family transcriptional regulator [Actinomycetota bacterium]NDE83321.1 LytR family transcriptional regulator [Actinomycetota bacterium]